MTRLHITEQSHHRSLAQRLIAKLRGMKEDDKRIEIAAHNEAVDKRKAEKRARKAERRAS